MKKVDKLIYIPKDDKTITPTVNSNYWWKRLAIPSFEPTQLIFTKVPKVLEPMNKITRL